MLVTYPDFGLPSWFKELFYVYVPEDYPGKILVSALNVNIAVVCFWIVSAWLCAHGELCAPKIASTRLNVWGPEPRGDGRLREVWRGRQ